MKRKKLLSLILAGALSLSLCVPALADGPEAAPTAEEWSEPVLWTAHEASVPFTALPEGESVLPLWDGTEEPAAPGEWTGPEEPIPSPEEEAGGVDTAPAEPPQPAAPWYAEAQQYVMEHGIMSGSGVDFDPFGTVTRVVAFHSLWNMEGMPPEKDVAPFSDVALDAWYQDSASWAREAGITQGDGAGHYNPQWTISRAELACAFYRYAQFKGADMAVVNDDLYLSYSDALSVPDYASDAFRWAVDRGIINGKVQDWVMCLDFGGSATRAELATMLMRLDRLLSGEVSAQTPESQSAS